MKKLLIILFFTASVLTYSQESRDEVKIYIPTPMGGAVDQQLYFQENMKMETIGAGYSVTDSVSDSDYTLNLYIRPNRVLYEDGTEELAPPDQPQYSLDLVLVRTGTGEEVVQFSFFFTELEEMNDFNLYLLYSAAANIPLTKVTGIIEDDQWRHKWLYLWFSLDFNVPVYIPDPDNYELKEGVASGGHLIHHEVPFAPGISLGMELHFLNWMSAELGLILLLGNVSGVGHNYEPVGTFDLRLKFALKPAKHYMIEPFFGIAVPLALMGTNLSPFGVQGGIQLATKAGSMGGFFINFRGEYDLGKAYTTLSNANIDRVEWTRYVISISAGYKLGIVDRKK